MVVINCLDFLFTMLTIITFGLAIWHVFDNNVGTEFDWFVAVMFGFLAVGYDIIVRYTVEVTWNRLHTIGVTIIYMVVYFLIIRKMTKGSKYEVSEDDKAMIAKSRADRFEEVSEG